MGSFSRSEFCAGIVIVSYGSDAEHHDHYHAESAGRPAVAEHHHHDHDAGYNAAAEPDDARNPNHDQVEASPSEDNAADRQYDHDYSACPAEQFDFEYHHHDHHASSAAVV
jgi:hypothetical protein